MFTRNTIISKPIQLSFSKFDTTILKQVYEFFLKICLRMFQTVWKITRQGKSWLGRVISSRKSFILSKGNTICSTIHTGKNSSSWNVLLFEISYMTVVEILDSELSPHRLQQNYNRIKCKTWHNFTSIRLSGTMI